MNHLQYSDVTSQVGLHDNHFISQSDPLTSRIHFQTNNIAEKLGHSIIPQVMNETCRYQLNTTLQNFDTMMKQNGIYLNSKSYEISNNLNNFKESTSLPEKRNNYVSYTNQLFDTKIFHKNLCKQENEYLRFPMNFGSNKSSAALTMMSSTVSGAGKSKFMIDVGTMTDPLTPEEQERLCQWEGFAALQSGNKVAEYLTSLREFLKVRYNNHFFISLIILRFF